MKEPDRVPVLVLVIPLTLSSFAAVLQELAMAVQQSLSDWLDPQLFSQFNRLIVTDYQVLCGTARKKCFSM